MKLIQYVLNNYGLMGGLLLQHLQLTGIAILSAIAIGVPLGILITRYKSIAGPILAVSSVFQTIPSIAFFGVLIPFLGIGKKRPSSCCFCMRCCPSSRIRIRGLKKCRRFSKTRGRAWA